MLKYYKHDLYNEEITIGRKSYDDGTFRPGLLIRQNHEINGFEIYADYNMFRETTKHLPVFEFLGKEGIKGITLSDMCKIFEKELNYKELKIVENNSLYVCTICSNCGVNNCWNGVCMSCGHIEPEEDSEESEE